MKLSKGFLYTFTSAVSWAIYIVITRFILRSGESPYTVLLWMAMLSAPYWLLIFLKNRAQFRTITKKDVLVLVGMGILGMAGVNFVEMFALKYSPAVNYSFLVRMVIPFTIVLAYIFLHEAISKKKILLVSLILIGAYLLTTQGQLLTPTRGDLFTLFEALLIALSSGVLTKVATNRMSTGLGASGRALIGLPFIVLIALSQGGGTFPKMPFLILLLPLFDILLTQMRFRAYVHASASFVTMIFSFTPVIVALISVPLLKETLTPIQILGGGLIVLSGILVEKLKI